MRMLILFDIDATLIRTSGAGIRAMVSAARSLFGESFGGADGMDFAGGLDPLILRDLLTRNGIAPTPEHLRMMRAEYRSHLERALTTGVGVALPGVMPLIEALAARPGLTLGLLTGNFAETGRLKLTACGIDPDRFTVCAWGDDSPRDPPARDHLPPIAMGRYRTRYGRDLSPSAVTIIGDTPHDVACALAHGCRVLGVATGPYNTEALLTAGAHRAVRDLSDTDDLTGWLCG
jgi:phosphoglycolate phosphatase-like HAD superfamily hydrolase